MPGAKNHYQTILRKLQTMSLIPFILILLAVYIAYYAINFFFDFLKARHGSNTSDGSEQHLSFSEDIPPQTIEEVPEVNLYNFEELVFGEDDSGLTETLQVSPISGFGGISMKEAIGLALAGAIHYTKQVSY